MRGNLKNAVLTLLSGLALSGTAMAGTIFTIDTTSIPNSVLATALISGSTTTFDVRGVAQVDVFNPGFLGAVLLADSAGGTGGFTTPPFGNNFLLSSNFGSETGFVGFSLISPVFSDGGLTLTLEGLGLPISPVITDPALAQFMTTLDYRFEFLTTVPVGDGTAVVFGLASITEAPEGNSAWLIAAGVLTCLIQLRRGKVPLWGRG